MGFSRTLTDYTPAFAVEDTLDQTYHTLNLADPPRNSLRGQGRVDLLELWDLRLGYFFWGHHVKYDDRTLDNLVKVDKRYPHSHYYRLQGVSLAWNLDYQGFATRSRMPFLVGGVGKYDGYRKDYYYVWIDEAHTQAEIRYDRQSLMKDWGYFAGAGMTFFKHLYVYAGMTQLMGEGLPGSCFLDLIVGITF